MALRREDLLLLFIGLPGGPFETDQIRVMKGMFLLSKEGSADTRDLSDFSPYDYGPFDTSVYSDLDGLESQGLIRADVTPGSSQRIFDLSARGQRTMARLLEQVPNETLEALRAIKKRVTSLSFLRLLRHVYEKYPAYASRSVLRP